MQFLCKLAKLECRCRVGSQFGHDPRGIGFQACSPLKLVKCGSEIFQLFDIGALGKNNPVWRTFEGSFQVGAPIWARHRSDANPA